MSSLLEEYMELKTVFFFATKKWNCACVLGFITSLKDGDTRFSGLNHFVR